MNKDLNPKAPTIKIPFKPFIEIALNALYKSKYPNLDPSTVKFMKTRGYESDGECYEIPDYLEVQLETK